MTWKYRLLIVLSGVIIPLMRFSTIGINGYIFILPLLFILVTKKSIHATLLLLSLFLVEDGGISHGVVQTPWLLRYLVCISCFFYIVINATIIKPDFRSYLVLILLLFAMISPFLYGEKLNVSALNQSALILLTLLIARFIKSKMRINMKILIPFLIGYVVGEYFLYFTIGGREFLGLDYLNYSSLKWLITIVPIYYLCNGRMIMSLTVAIFTLPVLTWYGTRIILLVFLMSYILLLILHIPKIKFGLFLVIISLVINLIPFEIDLTQNKMLSLLHYVKESQLDFDRLLLLADRVRYFEFKLFFSQDLFRLLFGNGIGTGLADPDGLLNFVARDGLEFAFSPEELTNKHYFGFHDVIIDLGVRFGLLLVVVEFYEILLNKKNSKKIILYMLFCSIYISLYTTLGIFFYFLLRHTTNEETAIYNS